MPLSCQICKGARHRWLLSHHLAVPFLSGPFDCRFCCSCHCLRLCCLSSSVFCLAMRSLSSCCLATSTALSEEHDQLAVFYGGATSFRVSHVCFSSGLNELDTTWVLCCPCGCDHRRIPRARSRSAHPPAGLFGTHLAWMDGRRVSAI